MKLKLWWQALAVTLSLAGPLSAQTWNFPIPSSALSGYQVNFNGSAGTLTDYTAGAGTVTWNVRTGGATGTVVGTLQLSGTSSTALVATLTALAAGSNTYGYGVGIKVAASASSPVKLLDATTASGTELIQPGLSTAVITEYYPYNWTKQTEIKTVCGSPSGHATIVNNLVIPGFTVGGVYYAEDTWRLTQLDYHGDSDGADVDLSLVKSYETNAGRDSTSTAIALAQNGTDSFTVLAAPSLQTLLNARFGTPHAVTGRITTLYNGGWTLTNPADARLTLAQYANFACRLAGSFDIVIVRTLETDDATLQAIAATFANQGIKPYFYLYAGGVPRLQGGGFDPAVMSSWFIYDSSSPQQLYTAPFPDPVNAPWALLDLRQSAVRQYFIDRAVQAVTDGFQGIYFDTPDFFIGTDGWVGGSVPGATDSWEYSRLQLISGTRTAIATVNADARIGILGDSFSDGQYLADFTLKEGYGARWNSDCTHGIDANPFERSLANGPATNADWSSEYRPYMLNSLFIGQQGTNPLFVGTGLDWGTAPSGSWYGGDDQLASDAALDFDDSVYSIARLMQDVAQYERGSLVPTITGLSPAQPTIYTYGPSVIAVPAPTTLNFSASVPMLDLSNLTVSVGAAQMLTPSSTPGADPAHPVATTDRHPYIIAERHETNNWYRSGYGFVYDTVNYYAYGDVYFTAKPTGGTNSTMVFLVETSPGPIASGAGSSTYEPANNGAFAAGTIYFHFNLTPQAIYYCYSDASGDHSVTVNGPFVKTNGVFTLTLPNLNFINYKLQLYFTGTAPTSCDLPAWCP